MEYNEISKTQFRDSYNIVKILTSKDEIMEYAKTLKNNNNQAVAFAIRKRQGTSLEGRMTSLEEKFVLIMKELKGIKDRLDSIEDRLDRNHIY